MDFRTHDIATLRQEIAAYRITPADIASHCIAQISRLESDLGAWASFDPEQLMRGATEAALRLARGEPLRALEAIPVGVKDIFNTEDLVTEMGSPLWAGFTPGNDARAVFNLKRAGGLVAGKTVTAEFAVHTLGKTINPWAPDRTPGTSSSGSAVAVATGMVPAALGTQTAGSIIRPASFCGVYGMKPSFGLIPRTGMLKTTDSLDSVGFFAGHASDLGILLDALRVHGRNFPISHAALADEARQSAPTGRPWRVALVRPHVWPHSAAHARAAIDAWVRGLDADARFEVTEAALPSILSESHDVHAAIYNRALAYYFQTEFQQADRVSPVMRSLIEAGQSISPRAYADALDRQVEIARAVERLALGFDVIVTLSTAGEAPQRHVPEAPDSALVWTLAQVPSLSAPVFRSPDGLPFGLQVVARRYNDPLLLRFVAEAVERGYLPKAGHVARRVPTRMPKFVEA